MQFKLATLGQSQGVFVRPAFHVPHSILLFSFFIFVPSPLLAQTTAEHPADSTATKGFLPRGRPWPECRTFALTEFGYSRRLISDERDSTSGGWLFTGEVGIMANRGARSAWGATVFCEFESEGFLWGIRPRYRRWLTRSISCDVAPGILVDAGTGAPFEGRSPAFSGQVSLNFSDLIALTSQVDVIHGAGGTRTEMYAGIRGGGEVAIVSAFSFVVLVAFMGMLNQTN
jgi:hypothetical protein